MNLRRRNTVFALVGAVAVLQVAGPSASADPRFYDERAEGLEPVDVALASRGVLQGQVLSPEGQPLPGVKLLLRNSYGKVWETESNGRGEFTFASIQGGVYQIVHGQQSHLIRAWAAGTAPPGAPERVSLVPAPEFVRGQWTAPRLNNVVRRTTVAMTNPLIAGSVFAAAVGIPIILHNQNQDDAPVSP